VGDLDKVTFTRSRRQEHDHRKRDARVHHDQLTPHEAQTGAYMANQLGAAHNKQPCSLKAGMSKQGSMQQPAESQGGR